MIRIEAGRGPIAVIETNGTTEQTDTPNGAINVYDGGQSQAVDQEIRDLPWRTVYEDSCDTQMIVSAQQRCTDELRAHGHYRRPSR